MKHQHEPRVTGRHRAPSRGVPLTFLLPSRSVCTYSVPLIAGVIALGAFTGPAWAESGEVAPTTPASYHVPTEQEIAAKRAQAASLAAQAANTQTSLNAAYSELSRLQTTLEAATAAEAEARSREEAARKDAADQEARLANAQAEVDQIHTDTGEWAAKTYRGDQLGDSGQMFSVFAGSTSPEQLADRVQMAKTVSNLQSVRAAEAEQNRAIAADASTRAAAATDAADQAHADAIAARQQARDAVDAQTNQAMLINALLSRQRTEASAASSAADQMADTKAKADAEAKRLAEEAARQEAARVEAARVEAARVEAARVAEQARQVEEEKARQAAAAEAEAAAQAAAAAAAQAAAAQAAQAAAAEAEAQRSQSADELAAAKKARDAALAAQAAAEAAAAAAPAPAPAPSDSGCMGGDVSGYSNGKLPTSKLCPLWGAPGHRLQGDAARAFNQMSMAYADEFGAPICVTDSYRTYESQVRLKKQKPHLAATPGRSNHGWARAVDLCGGIQSFSTRQHKWMQANAPKYGWCDPYWARAGGSKPEPWHWQYQDCKS